MVDRRIYSQAQVQNHAQQNTTYGDYMAILRRKHSAGQQEISICCAPRKLFLAMILEQIRSDIFLTGS